MNVERQCLAREIVNILACEGPDRVERYEVAVKWRARMTMAGFTPCPFNSNVITGIKSILKSYCDTAIGTSSRRTTWDFTSAGGRKLSSYPPHGNRAFRAH